MERIIVGLRVVVQNIPLIGPVGAVEVLFGIHQELLEVAEVVSLVYGGFLAHLILELIGTTLFI